MGSVEVNVEGVPGGSSGSSLRGVALPVLTLFVTLFMTLFMTLFVTLFITSVVASRAHALPLIPFDGPVQGDYSFGFVNPESYGITTFREFTEFHQAVPHDTPGVPNPLIFVDPVSSVRCPRTSDNCNLDFHVVDVVWDITFNAGALGDPDRAYDVDLILVDSDPFGFDGLTVKIDYDSAKLDGASLELQTASLNNGDYYFVDFVLGSMLDGETKRVGFTYEAEGRLPFISGGEAGFAYPVILPGSYVYSPVPEPGTGVLVGVGLAALAVRRRRV